MLYQVVVQWTCISRCSRLAQRGSLSGDSTRRWAKRGGRDGEMPTAVALAACLATCCVSLANAAVLCLRRPEFFSEKEDDGLFMYKAGHPTGAAHQ